MREICPPPNCPKTKHKEFKSTTLRTKVFKLRASEMRDICKQYDIDAQGKTKLFLQRAILDYAESCAVEGILSKTNNYCKVAP